MIAALALAMAALRPGIWSSVHHSPQSGDADGIELAIGDRAATRAGFTICEGGCSPRVEVALRPTPIGFAFDYAQAIVDGAGRPGLLPVRHAEARWDGDVLVVVWLHEDSVDILRRRAHALAIPRETPVLVK